MARVVKELKLSMLDKLTELVHVNQEIKALKAKEEALRADKNLVPFIQERGVVETEGCKVTTVTTTKYQDDEELVAMAITFKKQYEAAREIKITKGVLNATKTTSIKVTQA